MRLRSNLAIDLMMSEQSQHGIEEAQSALKFFEKAGAETWISFNANNLSNAFLELDNLEQAADYARKVMSLEEPSTYGYGIFTLGEVFRRQANYEAALETLKMSLAQAQRTEDRYLIAYCYQALGEVQIGLNNHDKALAILVEAEKLFEEMEIAAELEKTRALIKSIT